MLKLTLSERKDAPFKILCLGSHADDIEIGCGGTIIKLNRQITGTCCKWIVFSANETRGNEALHSASFFLKDCAAKQIHIENFRDGFFPFQGVEIKEYFECLKLEFDPDIIFTHYRHDLHQDHRLISDLTWNTFRHHLILEYEIPKYDGDIGVPNFFVHLDKDIWQKKIERVLYNFPSQDDKRWFTGDVFRAFMRLRGMESCAPSRYAEAFYARKIILKDLKIYKNFY
jgi:LmbE family N-acetylglucosaminyl deacetylase